MASVASLVALLCCTSACISESRPAFADGGGDGEVSVDSSSDLGPEQSDDETAAGEIRDDGTGAPDGNDVSDDDARDSATDIASADLDDAREGDDSDDVSDTFDAVEGQIPDTVDPLDAEVGGETQVEVTPECVRSEDCSGRPGASACSRWECVLGTCSLTPANEGGLCDDGDRCSVGDVCRSGVCVSGVDRLLCPAPAAGQLCVTATCAPTSGCGFVPAGVGTSCSNGTGFIPGRCVSGGFYGPDVCDGTGNCVDAPQPSVSGTTPRLGGSWFLVHTTFGRYAATVATRAILEVDGASHTIAVKASHHFGSTSLPSGDTGFLCAASDGRVEARLPLGRLIGDQIDQRLAVFSDTTNDGLAVLLRTGDAEASDVSGTYSYLHTTLPFGYTTPATWRGTMTFSGGCLMGGTFLTDPDVSGPYDFSVQSGGDCLVAATEVGETDLFRLQTSVRAVGSPTTYQIPFRGAVGKGGDIVLMIKELDTRTLAPEYGVMILVRNGAALDQAELAGYWEYFLHAKAGTTPARRDVGTLHWGATGTIVGGEFGTLEGTVVAPSGWFMVDDASNQLSQQVMMPGLPLYQSGVVDPSGRFIMGWTVAAPPDGSTPSSLNDVPSDGSLLLMLRTGP